MELSSVLPRYRVLQMRTDVGKGKGNIVFVHAKKV